MSTSTLSPRFADPCEIDRCAFNSAFYELGLRWHWDRSTYDVLAIERCERTRLRRYLEVEQSHLLRAYESEFLTEAILVAKERCRQAFAKCTPHAIPSFNWSDARRGEVGF